MATVDGDKFFWMLRHCPLLQQLGWKYRLQLAGGPPCRRSKCVQGLTYQPRPGADIFSPIAGTLDKEYLMIAILVKAAPFLLYRNRAEANSRSSATLSNR